MFYAALAYRFHLERPEDRVARMLELYDAYSLVRPLPDTHFVTGFGHLAGYTSAYYTYMWSLVIAKDLFSAFDPDDLFAAEVATRYRDRVLAAGWVEGRGRAGGGLPGPSLQHGRVHGVAERVTSS